jgi:hypothetical protein
MDNSGLEDFEFEEDEEIEFKGHGIYKIILRGRVGSIKIYSIKNDREILNGIYESSLKKAS